ncbi:MAG TPA: PSD1 and planctomycete cytochrome C domain-containing protein [Pirellulales bacterium]|nr:PSD1 and planctomycete cytochrome C domain-containing protein [Pirellulales bacterium]
MKRTFGFTAVSLIASVAIAASTLNADQDHGRAPVDFAREILPILSNKCFVCHGPDGKDKDELRLDSYAAATADRGGHRVIDPAAPEDSEILVRIHSADDPMPPEDAEKQLTPNERDLISRWVRQGGKYALHWAFVPPRKQRPANLGAVSGSDTVLDGEMIDAFVLARLQEKGIPLAPEADRATLARRVALVLTGLPAEPELLAEFLADNSEGAYERLVDKLLEGPRFGEHQARYWLDAVRYGDTHGLHLDNRRAIYPYRDWVVHAFNTNLPLDDFITWQIAGDLLPAATLAQRVATGYVRLNPSTSEGGAIPEEFQAKNNFDRTESLGTVFLGMSLTCARCHTHKYDPIPQTEYYRLLAFFNNTAEHSMDAQAYVYGPAVKAPTDQDGWKQWQSTESARDELFAVADSEVTDKMSTEDAQKWTAGGKQDRLLVLADPAGPFAQSPLHQQAVELIERIAAVEAKFTETIVAQELPKPRTTRVLKRGEYNLPFGEPLQPGILEVMGSFPADAPRNRLGLARWLTAREHPLVARVLINQIWLRTLGDGLVRTPEDFGLQGEQPTHSELLDWLAVELHDSDWNLKHMLRLMVTSRTFRQRSAWREDVDDPENRLWSRGPGHRLDAEVLRDISLWASGMLDPHMGGEGVKPYQPSGMWSALMHPASNTKLYVQDKGQKLYRRSLYVYWKRTSPHPMMTLFDAPDRESSCVRRSRTNTSLQSLGLLNETQRIETSRMLAERLLRDRRGDAERLNVLFGLLTCRHPTDAERAACDRLLQTMRGRYVDAEADALALLSTGDAPRDEKLDPTEHAAWTQVVVTVLASDAAILLY